MRWRRGLEYTYLAVVVLVMASVYYVGARSETAVIQGRALPMFVEDIYISMRYARHLVDGHGLAWNVGGAPIEGYTNFLWILWIALLMTVFKEPSYEMLVSAAGLHIIAVVLFYWLLRRRYQVHWLPACAATLLLAAWEPIRTQVFTAQEAPLLLCLFVTSLYLLSAEPTARAAGLSGAIAAGMLPLVRPDGLFLTVLLMILYLGTRGRRLNRDDVRQCAAAAVCFLGPVLLLSLFRLVYFGDLLPNTYYLKVTIRPGRLEYGIAYVWRFLKTFYGTLLLLPLLAFSIVEGRAICLVAAAGMVGILAYVAYQGGDFADWWRFMIPMLPWFLILFALLATKCLMTARLRALGIILSLAVLIIGVRREYDLVATHHLFPTAAQQTINNIRLGMALKAVCSDQAVTADFSAGAAPYFSGLRSIDMLGRSDAVIARKMAYKPGGVPGHDKFDVDYVLRSKPDVIVTHPLALSRADLDATKNGVLPFGAYILESLERDTVYVPVASVLSETWQGIYARGDSRQCDWARMSAVERALGLTCSVSFSDEWAGIERQGALWWRWNNGQGTVRILSNVAGAAAMRGWLMAASPPDTVDVFVNGVRRSPAGGITVDEGRVAIDMALPLTLGETKVEFAARRPAVPLERDTRAIGVGNLEMVPMDGAPACVSLGVAVK
jgi:hypothetical protein